MSEPTKISTGIEGLDHALDSLRTGDNVVWPIIFTSPTAL